MNFKFFKGDETPTLCFTPVSFEPSNVINPPLVVLLYVGPLFSVAVLELDVKLSQEVPEPG